MLVVPILEYSWIKLIQVVFSKDLMTTVPTKSKFLNTLKSVFK